MTTANDEETRGRRRESEVHETVRELVTKASTQLRGKGNGATTQAHDSMGPIEASARETRTRVVKPASEMEALELNFSAGAGVKSDDLFREESGGERAIGVTILVATGAVEYSVVARVGARVGDEELTSGVEAVVGGERGGVAGEECGSGGAVVAGGAGDPDEIASGVGYEEEGLRRGA